MPNVGRHRENALVFKKFADRKFVVLSPVDLILQICGGLKLRYSLVPLLFVLLERHRAVPFLAADGQELFWAIGKKSNIAQKEFVVRSSDSGIIGHGVELRLQPGTIRFQRENRFLRSRSKFRSQGFVSRSAVVQHGRNLTFNSLQFGSNLLQISNCQLRKGADSVEVRLPIINDPGDVLHPLRDLAAARSVKWRRLHQRFQQRGERLVEIERRVPLPSRIDIQLPAHAGKRRSHQSVIDLSSHGPTRWVDLLPLLFEVFQCRLLLRNGTGGPIPRTSLIFEGTLDARYIVLREGLITRSPLPEVMSKCFQ